MDPLIVFHRYLDAWNSRRPDLIASAFGLEGTYSSPAAGEELVGDQIAEHAQSLFAAFPDLSFEIVSEMELDQGSVVVRWRMRGTNTGSLFGSPPLGNQLDLPGAEFIQVDGDQVRSVVRYFDQKTMLKQMGFVLSVLPAQTQGPVSFGGGVRVSGGSRTQPGAFSITVLHARSDKEISEVSSSGQRIAAELLAVTGTPWCSRFPSQQTRSTCSGDFSVRPATSTRLSSAFAPAPARSPRTSARSGRAQRTPTRR